MTFKKKRNNKIKKRKAAEALREHQQQLRAGWAPIVNGSSHPFLKKAFAYTSPQSLVFMVQHESKKEDDKEEGDKEEGDEEEDYPAYPIPTHVQLDASNGEIWGKPCDPHEHPGPDQDPDIFLSLEKITLTDQQFYALHLMNTMEIWEPEFWEDHLNTDYELVLGRRDEFLAALANGDMEDAWNAVETIASIILQHNAKDVGLGQQSRKNLWNVNAFTGEKRLPAEWFCKVDMTDRVQWVLRDRRTEEGKRKQLEEDLKIQEEWLNTTREHTTDDADENGDDGGGEGTDEVPTNYVLGHELLSAIENYAVQLKHESTIRACAAARNDLLERELKDTEDDQPGPSSSFSSKTEPSHAEDQDGPQAQSKHEARRLLEQKISSLGGSRGALQEAMAQNMGKQTKEFKSMAILIATPIIDAPYRLVPEGSKQGYCLAPSDLFAAMELGHEEPVHDNKRYRKSRSRTESHTTSTETESGSVGMSKAEEGRDSATDDGKDPGHEEEREEAKEEAEEEAQDEVKDEVKDEAEDEAKEEELEEEESIEKRLAEGKFSSTDMLYFACQGVDEVLDLTNRALKRYGQRFLEDSRFIITTSLPPPGIDPDAIIEKAKMEAGSLSQNPKKKGKDRCE